MDAKHLHILIVDEEERFRETTSSMLRKWGFDVTAVGNGIDAVQKIKEGHVDVVVLDIKMPGVDSDQALYEIRAIQHDLPVIMLTGGGIPHSAKEGLEEGVFDYLTKPCAIDLLVQKIREASSRESGVRDKEARVCDLMIPLDSFSSVRLDQSVAEAIELIVETYNNATTTLSIHESIHRSSLVLDDKGHVAGIITYTDILHGLLPEYMDLAEHKPMLADSMVIESPVFSGMFTIMARDLANKKVKEIMSDAPPIIAADENLMEAACVMLKKRLRRLLVAEGDEIVGVIREQDLFFEIAKVLHTPISQT